MGRREPARADGVSAGGGYKVGPKWGASPRERGVSSPARQLVPVQPRPARTGRQPGETALSTLETARSTGGGIRPGGRACDLPRLAGRRQLGHRGRDEQIHRQGCLHCRGIVGAGRHARPSSGAGARRRAAARSARPASRRVSRRRPRAGRTGDAARPAGNGAGGRDRGGGRPPAPASPGVRDSRWQAIATRVASPQRILAGLRAGVAEGWRRSTSKRSGRRWPRR